MNKCPHCGKDMHGLIVCECGEEVGEILVGDEVEEIGAEAELTIE